MQIAIIIKILKYPRYSYYEPSSTFRHPYFSVPTSNTGSRISWGYPYGLGWVIICSYVVKLLWFSSNWRLFMGTGRLSLSTSWVSGTLHTRWVKLTNMESGFRSQVTLPLDYDHDYMAIPLKLSFIQGVTYIVHILLFIYNYHIYAIAAGWEHRSNSKM